MSYKNPEDAKAYRKRWAAANKDKQKATRDRYRKRHAERLKAKDAENKRKWRAENKEEFREYRRQLYRKGDNETKTKARLKRWRKRNPTKFKAQKKRYYPRKTELSKINHSRWRGIIKLERPATVQCENPRCKSDQVICFDHCHELKLHRGWLCRNCNTSLGMAKDSREILLGLIEYLDAFEARKNDGTTQGHRNQIQLQECPDVEIIQRE